MSVVLPWRKHEYILTAEANLAAAFVQHRERMITHLAQRLGMEVEEVRAVISPPPVPTPQVPTSVPPSRRRRGDPACRHGIPLSQLCEFVAEYTAAHPEPAPPPPPPPPPPLSAEAPPPSQRLTPMTVAPSRRSTDE